jgi:hypothetical protein
MNLNFLKDEHLKKALQHAPDGDVAPIESTRKAVLDYADNALKAQHKTRRESWFSRLISTFNAWQIPSWQLTGMGGLAASLLVVLMILYENPDDPIQVASAPETVATKSVQVEAASSAEPRPEPKLAQNELARDKLAKDQAEPSAQAATPVKEVAPAPAAASAEMATPKLEEPPSDKLEAKIVAKTKSEKQETAIPPKIATIEAPADKAVLASAPEVASAQGLEKDAGMRLKEGAATAEATVPAPISQPAPAVASADAASGQSAARTAEITTARKKMADAEEAESKTDLPSAVATTRSALPAGNALAIELSRLGGQALANNDIQSGKLRILYLSNTATSSAADEATGYKKEAVIVGDESSLKSLATVVEAYNLTMRKWHLNH